MNEEQIERLEKLVTDLAAPIFGFRMSRNNPHKGSGKRKENSLAEIDRLVREYAEGR